MRKVVLIRHGVTMANLENRYIGAMDQPLTDLGKTQARDLASALPACDYVFSSPLLRCRETAKIIFPHQKIDLVKDLREFEFGIFEGKSAEELKNNSFYNQWVESNCNSSIPEGEDMGSFKKRVIDAFLQDLLKVPVDSVAAFVIHGGTIMAILEHFIEAKRSFYEYRVGNCQHVICNYMDDKLIITGGDLCL